MAEDLGTTLQRGGEALALSKARDRFTVRPASVAAIAELPDRVSANYCARVPVGSHDDAVLLEFQVADASQLDAAMEQTRDLADVAFVSHVYQIQDNPGAFVYLADDITVQFADETAASERDRRLADLGLAEQKPLDGLPHTYIYRVTAAATENPIKIANRLAARDDVLIAEPNIVIRSALSYRPNDDAYPQQWYLHHNGGYQLAPGSHVYAEKAWDITRGDRSIVVAITDDSIDLDHPDFQGVGKIVAPRDLRGKDFLPLPETQSDNHGTACAGVCLAEENGIGIVGVAPGCALMPVRTSGYLDDTSIEELFDWAIARGAAVISCSWGASAVYFRLSLRQQAAIARAASRGRHGKGCVVVFAAGNANRPVQGELEERGWTKNVLSGKTRWLSGFAIHPNVIAVSACTSLNQKAAYSNWGNEISVCAPSNNAPPGIWLQETGYVATAPRITKPLPGRGVFTTDRVGDEGYTSGNYTSGFGGTSSACPVVAGVAALVLSVNPDLTAAQVRKLLEDTADKISDREPDPQLGTRYGTYDGDGHSKWFGYGKVNAYKAVTAARQQRQAAQTVTRRVRGTNDRAIAIPDADPEGARSPIRVVDELAVRELYVSVEVDHSYVGDLELYLIAPDGTRVMVAGRGRERPRTLAHVYSFSNAPQLRKFWGMSAAGTWYLQVCDRAEGDSGRLLRWQLTLGMG